MEYEVYANTCKSHLEKLIVLNNKLLHIAQNCSGVASYEALEHVPPPLDFQQFHF